MSLPPRQHAPGRLLHDLTVVEVAAWLMARDLAAGWITERELLRDELSRARDQDGRLRRGPGRRPDGVLVRASGRSEAVEVELTPKRDRAEYDHKLAWYQGQLDYQVVHWFVPSFTLRERLVRVAYELQLDDLVRVAALPPGLDYLPRIKADRRPSRPSTLGHPYRSPPYAVEPWPDTARSLRPKHS